MPPAWPSTDPRRARALLEELTAAAAAMAPDWVGLGEAGDFGAALYQIAARLGEQTTRRLDQTAQRDMLAFLDALAQPGSAPRAASAPVAFTLTEKRTTPVFAAQGVQLIAKAGQEELAFETREAVDITPARIGALILADPASDRIEQAPAAVLAGTPAAAQPLAFTVVSPAEPGATVVQLAQSVGLAAGDLLRIGTGAYRVHKVAGELVTLLDPLTAAVAAGARIGRIDRLEAITLRNVQEHVAYFGHAELLKLDRPAVILLTLEPPSVGRRLTELEVGFALWGTRAGDKDPAWHDLALTGADDEGVRLVKSWEGSVDAVKVEGRNGRWLRVRLEAPIDPAAPPKTRAVAASLKVRSLPNPADDHEGSKSISSAFHNALPLPLTSPFYPFGPEPQRFDTFAVAAPEALSKRDATVTLQVNLTDASAGVLALAMGRTDRAYGVGRNGRLQTYGFAGAEVRWRQLTHPVDVQAGGRPEDLRLDPARPPQTLKINDLRDVVVAADRTGRLWSTLVTHSDAGSVAGLWSDLGVATQGADAWSDFAVAEGSIRPFEVGAVLALNADGLHRRAILANGAVLPGWTRLANVGGTDIASSDRMMLTAALACTAPAHTAPAVAVLDGEGKLHLGKMDAALTSVSWQVVADTATPAADRAVRPVLAQAGGGFVLAAASATERKLFALSVGSGGGAATLGPINFVVAAETALASLPWVVDAGQPLIAAAGEAELGVWSGQGDPETFLLPAGAETAASYRVLLVPSAARPSGASLLLSGDGEVLFRADLAETEQQVQTERFDAVATPSSTNDDDLLAVGDLPAPAAPLGPVVLRFGNRDYRPVDRALGLSTKSYRVARIRAAGLTGSMVSASELTLDAGDSDTAAGSVVLIDGKLHEVASVAGAPKVAQLAQATTLAAGAVAAYDSAVLRTIGGSQVLTVPPERLGTLVRIAGMAEAPEDASGISYPGAAPAPAAFSEMADDGIDTWLLLSAPWTTAPAGAAAALQLPPSLGGWTVTALARNYQNPELAWEYFNGATWRRLDQAFVDTTANLARSGAISFRAPLDLAQNEVAGQTDYWVRARLVGGDYGRATYVIETENTGSKVKQSIQVDTSSVNPPEIRDIEATYALDAAVAPETVLSVNNLAVLDQSQAALSTAAQFDVFSSIDAHMGDGVSGRAIYLQLTREPGVAALNLYVDAVESDEPAAKLAAETLTIDGWRPLQVDDATGGLLRPGLLQLMLTSEPAELPLFGANGWWIRLSVDAADWRPVVSGVFLNAAMADQAKTVSQELLGSSLGEPNQSYALAQPPILPGSLELRVRETLSDEERQGLAEATGDAAVVANYANIPGDWVRWREVESFAGLDAEARAYRLDPATGVVSFGSGRRGKVPRAGRDSIRAALYRTGGGSLGDVPAGAIAKAKSAIESLERVLNPVAASGGADASSAESLAASAPARLRHGGRALTGADLEAMAVASAPDVVRAHHLSGDGGGFDLVVSIRKPGKRRPTLSRARREGMAAMLAERGWGGLAPAGVRVRSPGFVRIALSVEIEATAADRVAGVAHAARQALLDLTDPAIGPQGDGARFGRGLISSDVQRALAAIPGLDRVARVEIEALDGDLDTLAPDALIWADADDVAAVVTAGGGP